MKLDNNIIRDVLLCIEKQCESYTDDKTNRFVKDTIHWKLIYEDETLNGKYIFDDVKYCILKLGEANLIEITYPKAGRGIPYVYINDITWKGHEFLNNVRDDGVWKFTKSKIGDVTKISFSALAKIAAECVILYKQQQMMGVV